MRMGEFGDLQLAVMNALWTLGAASVHEVMASLTNDRPLAYTTVLTVLRNLEKRGVVAHKTATEGRMYRYYALIDASDARAEMVNELIERMFGGSALKLLQHLLDTESVSGQDVITLLSVNGRPLLKPSRH